MPIPQEPRRVPRLARKIKGADIEFGLGCAGAYKADLLQGKYLQGGRGMKDTRYEELCRDIKEKGYRDVCYICKHFDSNPECDCECDSCKKPCACNSCFDGSRWEWRGAQ